MIKKMRQGFADRGRQSQHNPQARVADAPLDLRNVALVHFGRVADFGLGKAFPFPRGAEIYGELQRSSLDRGLVNFHRSASAVRAL